MSEDVMGSLPIVYEGGPMTVNPMGGAMKYFEAGEEDSLVFLVQSAAEHTDQMGLTGQVPPPTQADLPRPQGPPPHQMPTQQQGQPPKKKGRFGGLFGKK
ncbi:MAG: hypothetical protein GWN18_17485 [Thermoplasmata archaeon]|nr:hypothetical protein [Thermoplasmata archaeon]NIS21752.1 hypothetical protein [Thermoplasmata archaeon]NIT79348.1 hypothetical protein [Thermoplasmata archaeon]NIU50785.1 hypothetical protein [Thermoplasmata archaeon]NIV80505.1 hypothetical protein [Thermoplasmata archaeon]